MNAIRTYVLNLTRMPYSPYLCLLKPQCLSISKKNIDKMTIPSTGFILLLQNVLVLLSKLLKCSLHLQHHLAYHRIKTKKYTKPSLALELLFTPLLSLGLPSYYNKQTYEAFKSQKDIVANKE